MSLSTRSLALLATPLAVVAALATPSQPADAHFVLLNPEATLEQGLLGDPQKEPPCGGDGNETGVVTPYHPGDTIQIKINEKIYHPGHYRVALAVNDPSELPAEPIVTPDNKSACGSAPIDPNPVFPVLADGMLVHTSSFKKAQTFEVTLPSDVTCTHCTLQVLEFMSNHALNNPGGCYYHHCATISIQADGPSAADTDGGGGEDTDTEDAAAGCGCDSTGGTVSGLGLLLLSGALARRRRAGSIAQS